MAETRYRMALAKDAAARVSILSPADLWRHLGKLGVHLSVERIWWHPEDRAILRVRDPMFALDSRIRAAIALWERELYARVTEQTGATAPLPAAWRKGVWCGVVDVPITAEEANVKQLRILNLQTGKLE